MGRVIFELPVWGEADEVLMVAVLMCMMLTGDVVFAQKSVCQIALHAC